MSGEYVGWIRTYQLSYNNFCLVIKETCSLALSWWKIFLLTDFSVFHWLFLDAFCWVVLLVGLNESNTIGINHLVFWKDLIIEDSLPIPPFTPSQLLWMKTGLWCGWWWFISFVQWCLPFHITLQYPVFIACHNLF